MRDEQRRIRMKIALHVPGKENSLYSQYAQAFNNAVELYIVTAYLTEWDDSLKLNSGCRKLRIIAGKDFGITRKKACEAVMKWLPVRKKACFLVADYIDGFHPKAVFWKQEDGKAYAIVGSSNLTKAAFESNYEANAIVALTNQEYQSAKDWIKGIEDKSVVVSQDWLKQYQEAVPAKKKSKKKNSLSASAVSDFWLPTPPDGKRRVKLRRALIAAYKKERSGLQNLFANCASGRISPEDFYEDLSKYWSYEKSTRIQGSGWQILGKGADFSIVSQCYQDVLKASADDRDDIVAEAIDYMAQEGVPARSAFFSEMLCLEFPDLYPVLNQPIKNYLSAIKFRAPRKASEGSKYIDLAKKLRISLSENPKHYAKNLAELDAVIESAYRSR